MFIQKRKSKIIYFSCIGSIAGLILIGLTFLDEKAYKANIDNNIISQLCTSVNYLAFISMYLFLFISFFITIYYYVTIFAKKNRSTYMMIAFIVGILVLSYIFLNDIYNFSSYLSFKKDDLLQTIFILFITLISFAACITFTAYLSFNKKFRTISYINFIGIQNTYSFVFWVGILSSCWILRIIFGRGENHWLWFVPDIKSNKDLLYRESSITSLFPNSTVEYIGILLFPSFMVSKKYRWYSSVYNAFILIIMIVATIVTSLDVQFNKHYLTDGFASIIITTVWFYVSKLIVDAIAKKLTSKRQQMMTGEVPESNEIRKARKQAKKEEEKISKMNEKMAKKQFKKESKQKNKEKSKVDKEIEELLKNASKEHKKKIKKGFYDKKDDDSSDMKI